MAFLENEQTKCPHLAHSQKNYFKSKKGVEKCRARFNSEIKRGRMLGGLGWTRSVVEKVLGRPFYTIPCGAVPKNHDPLGRIIHDYSFPSATQGSINAALVNTSIQYISFVERARLLSEVD